MGKTQPTPSDAVVEAVARESCARENICICNFESEDCLKWTRYVDETGKIIAAYLQATGDENKRLLEALEEIKIVTDNVGAVAVYESGKAHHIATAAIGAAGKEGRG